MRHRPSCPHCQRADALDWRPGYAGSREEPPEVEGYECRFCSRWTDEAPAGTMRRRREAMASAWAREARRRLRGEE